MAALVDTYKAKETGKDASTTIEIAGYEVEVKVNISKEDGNVLVLKGDGLYVPTPEKTDISGKADKVKSATSGNFAGLDENGNLTDSGKKADDFVAAEAGKRLMTDAEGTKLGGVAEGATKVEASETNGNVKVNGAEVTVYTEPTDVVHGAMLRRSSWSRERSAKVAQMSLPASSRSENRCKTRIERFQPRTAILSSLRDLQRM